MSRMFLCAVSAAAIAVSAAGGEAKRVAAELGDVRFQGPLAKTLEGIISKHIVGTDPVYLTECYKERTEKSLWQTEFWGKYMHTAAPFQVYSGCGLLRAKIDASVKNLISAQQPDGYLGNYAPASRNKPGTWEVWGFKYTMMGLLHYYDACGSQEALDACRKLCDYMIANLGPGAKQSIAKTGNYAGMPSCSGLEPVMWLYNRTKEKKYLDFAEFIVKEMTEREDGPRLLDLAKKNVPVRARSVPPKKGQSIWDTAIRNRGKAYEMMSCYQGLLEYGEVTGRRDLLEAAEASARNIIEDELTLAGSGASHEHWFGGAHLQHKYFGNLQETCVTITWMRLCRKLLELTGDPRYADELEKTFYNAYLAALRRDGSMFAAYTPMQGYRSEGHLHCRMHTDCCNANGPRGFLTFMEALLQADGDTVFLNAYASSRASIKVPATGGKVLFETHTLYPKLPEVDIRVRLPDGPAKFKLALRIPAWAAGSTLSLNGRAVKDAVLERGGGYAVIDRTWENGDAVELKVNLAVKIHRLDGHIAFTRGPVVLARDSRFGDGDLSAVVTMDFMPKDPAFALVASDDPDAMDIVCTANLPLGGHVENPGNGRLLSAVRFCDYASAGNEWRMDNYYRVWLPVECDLIDALNAK